jgi:hypothetical protein
LCVILQGPGGLLAIRLQSVGFLLMACLGLLPILHAVGLPHAIGFRASRAGARREAAGGSRTFPREIASSKITSSKTAVSKITMFKTAASAETGAAPAARVGRFHR